MKKYKIREGSFLCCLKGWWFIFLCACILVAIAFPKPTSAEAEAQTTIAETEKTETVIYDVPLDENLQQHINMLCNAYGVDMPLVLAIIGQESSHDPTAIGDDGESIGLMQIQPRYHKARMDRLGVTDLLDPYQNVAVGVDLLAELMSHEKGFEWAVTAYNAGAAAADLNENIGAKSEYTESVLLLRGEIANGANES